MLVRHFLWNLSLGFVIISYFVSDTRNLRKLHTALRCNYECRQNDKETTRMFLQKKWHLWDSRSDTRQKIQRINHKNFLSLKSFQKEMKILRVFGIVGWNVVKQVVTLVVDLKVGGMEFLLFSEIIWFSTTSFQIFLYENYDFEILDNWNLRFC